MSAMSKIEPKIGIYNWLAAKERLKNRKKEEIVEAVHDSPSSASEPEDYLDIYAKQKDPLEDLPADYWNIKKLLFYINSTNYVLCTMALICLKDYDFTKPIAIQVLKDENEINIIMNLVQSQRTSVQIAALQCLEKLAHLRSIRYEIVYFGGLQTMVPLLWEPNFELRIAVANTITRIAVFHRAWKMIRLMDGIPLLANMLYAPKELLQIPQNALSSEQRIIFDTAAAGAHALNALCEDKKNMKEFWKCGAITICALIVQSNHVPLLIAVIGLLQRCAAKKYFREAIRKSGILHGINRHLYEGDRALTEICAQAVFKCAVEKSSREFFSQKGFVDKIMEIINNPENHNDEGLMSSISGALWKCAKSMSNVIRIHTLGGIPILLELLKSHFTNVQVHIVGCLSLCLRHRPCCDVIRKYNGLEALINLLSTTHAPLIVNLNKALANACYDPETMKVIENLNAVEKVWSHLRNNNLWVVSCTAWSLCSLLENIKDCAGYVTSLIGGMEVVVNLLTVKYTRISTPACNLVVVLCRHKENLSLLTEYGVVKVLSTMVTTRCKRLRYYLCMAIYACAPMKNNLKQFAKDHIVKYLIKILKSKSSKVMEAACFPLCRLSVLPKCSQVIFQSKAALHVLMNLVNNDNSDVKTCAALIIQNIRLFSLIREENLTPNLQELITDRRIDLLGSARL